MLIVFLIIALLVAFAVLYGIAVIYLQTNTTNTTDIEDIGKCECNKYDCWCCAKLDIPKIDLQSKLCTNFTYLPDEYGVSVTITYNDVIIINETTSVKNPPPLCSLLLEELRIHICLRLYNLDYKNECFSGCAAFEVRIIYYKVKKIDLGCVNQCITIPKEEDSNLLVLKKWFENYIKQPIVDRINN